MTAEKKTSHSLNSDEGVQIDVSAEAELSAMSPEEFARMEKKLMWKVDLRLVPWLTVLFTMSFLDRINIGTAKLAGISTDLGMTPSQYNIASLIFFVSYVAFEIPSNMFLKKVKPSRWIPFIMVCWAIVQVCMGLVKTYGQLLALRFLLGMFESGLFPGLSFYLSSWYKRKEQSRRISLFFSGAVLSGSLGGVLGYALSLMNGIGGKAGWSWIFIIEGLLSFVVGLLSIFLVQDWPDEATFLNPLERALILRRLRDDTGVATQDTFTWSSALSALKDWKVWGLAGLYLCVAQGIYSQSLFVPTIIAALGKWTTAISLLLSAPPYAFAFFTTMLTAYLSDRTGLRGPFLIFWTTLASIAYILFLTVPITQPGVLYFAVFLAVSSIAPCIATTITWSGNNIGGHYKKAVGMGLVFSCGNSSGIIASLVYRSENSPRFLPGHGVTLAFCVIAVILSTTLHFAYRRENSRRDSQFGPLPTATSPLDDPELKEDQESEAYKARMGLGGMTTEEIVALGDRHPGFRYIL